MKRSLVFVFLLLILLSGSAGAQNIFGGIRIEPNFLLSNNQVHGPLGLNLEPAVNLGIKLSNGFSLEGRYGILFSEYFGGTQYSLFARKNISDENLYALGGVVLQSGFGMLHFPQENQSDFTALLGGGIGLNTSDNFSVELQYLKTLREETDYIADRDIYGTHKEYRKLYGIVKLSLSYNFSLGAESVEDKTALENEESAVETFKGKRRLFWSGGAGFPDLLSTQLGYQIMEHFSASGVLNWNVFSNPKMKEFTAGLKLTGYFSGPGFNNVSLEFGRRVDKFFSSETGGPTVLTIGGDNISIRYFHFFWAAGFMSWNDNGIYGAWPVFKFGTAINFF